MINRVVVLSGPISSGKSTLAKGLESRFGMVIFKTNRVLKQHVKPHLVDDRKALQDAGERLDRSTHGTWVRDNLKTLSTNQPSISDVVVDSVRIIRQVEALRKAFGTRVVHIHLTMPEKDLKKRYEQRYKLGQSITFAEARSNATEQQVDTLKDSADVVINTKRCTEKDVFTRVCCHLNLHCGNGQGHVDVLVGGQYGSEGKGQIAAYLAPEYDFLIRVGGPNAGHKVYEEPEPYPHHQLPSGTRRCQARLLIGPGATLYVPKLLEEIADCKVESDRLYIDEQAMIISDDDRDAEKRKGGVSSIGSTGQGVGEAMARRITGRSHKDSVQLAKDVVNLRPYVHGRILDVLDDAYSQGNNVLLEGTQGAGLSLYHGFYPYVTSRDTTVAGCLAEAGIPWNRVRRVIMVCRAYPIRVQNPLKGWSGPMPQEIDLSEISKRSGIKLDVLKKTETTTTTGRQRRISEFDWQLLRMASLLNGPTDIALTFTDYLHKKNSTAKRFDQLHEDTINFIEEVELVTGAPVSFIATGFNDRSVIDRRRW
jgi:adenylosuccinate synthase